MKFFIPLFLLLFTNSILAKDLDKESCPSFDYSDRFGPVQDQDGHGLCWAFAASALLSEDACLQNPKHCGINISPLDVSSCDKTLLTKNEGRSTNFGIMCAQQKGACYEKDFSFATQGDLLCGAMNNGPRCIHEKLADLYVSYQKRDLAVATCLSPSQTSELEKFVGQFQAILKKSPSRAEVTSLEVEQLLRDPKIKTWSAFLYKALKNENCSKERVDFSHIDQTKIMNTQVLKENLSLEDKVAAVKDRLAKGRSIGYSFCANKTQSAAAKLFSTPFGGCGPHDVVITGMRWNKGTCELNLRNSWGKGASLNGWMPAEKLLKHSLGIQQIETK